MAPRALLRGDPFVRLVLALFGVLCLPYLIPLFPEGWLWHYGAAFIDLPFLAVVIAALWIHFRTVRDPAERRFWGFLSVAFGCWVMTQLLGIVFAEMPPWAGIADVANTVLFFAFYALAAMALESRPDLPAARVVGRLRAFDRLGTLVFLFGLLLYFAVLPGLADADDYWVSSLALYVVLDIYIVTRLAVFRRDTRDPSWHETYTWLLLAFSWWLATDAVELLMWIEIIPYVDSGTLFDALWLMPYPFLVVALRSRGRSSAPVVQEPARDPLPTGPIVLYAVAVPLLHLVLYSFELADLALRPMRDLVAVGVAVALAGLAIAYQAMLERENRRLAEVQAGAQARIEYQALYDEVTGLPNRNLFRDHLRLAIAQAQRSRDRCAVVFIDLDRFKVVNDSLGHEAGDRVLVAVGERLRHAVREGDTVARLGGDEFAVLAEGLDRGLAAATLARHLISSFGRPLAVDGRTHVLTASLGIAIYPDDAEDESRLLKSSDLAMYQAKLAGGNTFRLFTPELNDEAEQRLAIETGLREALAAGHFEVHYQQIVDLESRQLAGVEALLRWNHPSEGQMRPERFIEVAETTGLIVPIGEWILEAACRWACEQPGDSWSLAVNLSARQLEEPDFSRRLAAILDQTGFSPRRLQLEITESLAVDADGSRVVLQGLRAMGVRIAIDDLGTGFSGLGRLRDLPVDVLKVDRSFVQRVHLDPVVEAIVQAIVGMARALDLYVVAEGVETEQQLEVVERLGCDAAQGYFLHEPRPAAQMDLVTI